MVAVSTLKTSPAKVSLETPEGTIINVNFNQRTCIDSLLDAARNVKMVKKDGQCNQPAKVSASGVHLGVGVSLMSLGFIGVMLAIIIDVVRPDLFIRYAGTHYWTGFPFVIAGALNVLTYKYPKTLWVILSYIGLLLCFCVSIAGIAIVSNDVDSFRWGWRWDGLQNLCENIRQRPSESRYGYQEDPPIYGNRDGDIDYNLERCKSGIQDYRNLLGGLVIMTLLMMIWGLCVSAITLLYRLKLFLSSCIFAKTEEEKDDDLLTRNHAQDIIIA